MSGPWQEFASASAPDAGPWQEFAGPERRNLGIDFSQPVAKVRAAIGKLPEGDREDALNQWAQAFVAKERGGQGAAVTTGKDVVRNLARGTPVGSWLDEANAVTMGGLHALTGGHLGAPRDETLAYNRALDKAVDSEASIIGSLPLIGDVSTAGPTKIAGAVASAPFAPVAHAMRGASLVPSMANAGVTGLLYGGLYGAGEGEDGLLDRAKHGAMGAAIGGLLGPVAAAAGRGISNVAGTVRDAMRPLPKPLAEYHPGAVDRVGRAVADDGIAPGNAPPSVAMRTGEGTYDYQARLLGPNGMLADMGPNLTEQAGGIVATPGAGQRIVRGALEDRAAGAKYRISNDLDHNLGEPVNLVKRAADLGEQAKLQARPQYEAFYQTEIPMTPELKGIYQAADALGALGKAQKLMAAERIDPSEITHNGRLADLVKRGIDDIAGSAPRGSNEHRVASNLARQLRDEIDRILSPNNLAESPWAKARAIHKDNFGIQDAIEQGGQVFKRGTHPHQLAEDMKGLTGFEEQAYRTAARSELRDVMGSASTKWGDNGDSAVRRALGSEFAGDKLKLLIGDEAGNNILRSVQREGTFDRTLTEATRNSKTAAREAASRELPSPFRDSKPVPDALWGDVKRVVAKAFNAASGGYMRERNQKIATDMAEMLIARGAQRDAIAEAIMSHVRTRAMSAAAKDRMTRMAMNVLTGGRPAAIEAATEGR